MRGWDPGPDMATARSTPDFLARVAHELRDHPELRDTSKIVQTVLGVIAARVSSGEIDQVVHVLPPDTRKLWLAAAFPHPSK